MRHDHDAAHARRPRGGRLGSDAYVYGSITVDDHEIDLVVRVGAEDSPRKNETVRIAADPETLHAFDTASGDRLPD